jgi:uncharacterized membrane protein YvbJ
MVVCKICGTSVDEDAEYCEECGAKLEEFAEKY